MKNTDREYIFGRLIQLADILSKETRILCELIDSIEGRDNIVKRISSYEDEADNVFHDIRFYYGTNKLTTSDDALALMDICISIEGVIDCVDELARDFYRYNITELKESSVTAIININRAATDVMQLFIALRKDEHAPSLFKNAIELDNYKVEASKLYDSKMNKLFTTETNPIEIIKWQAMYTSMLKVYEEYENVAEMCGKYIYRWE